jgi:uncharacterized protein (DUF433 family)
MLDGLDCAATVAPATAVASDFGCFAATLHRDLAPRSALERVLADRVTLAAWRLNLASIEESGAAREGDPLAPVSLEALRAERSLETALELLASVRGMPAAADRVGPTGFAAEIADGRPDVGSYSNEWPALPAQESPAPADWRARLEFDGASEDGTPVVRGTWATVGQVVSRIVDGWAWADVLRAHPELTEDDIRACMAYIAEHDGTEDR